MKPNLSIKPIPRNSRFKNLTNATYGNWTVLGFAGKAVNNVQWLCRCACGTIGIKFGSSFLSRRPSMSCGCVGRKAQGVKISVHGETRRRNGDRVSKEYEIFTSAKGRCNNPNNKDFPNYGGRGIEFRFQSITDFLQALGRRPSNQYSLERIDNNGHYEPQNVRWATRSEQQRNTRDTRLLTVDGVTKTTIEWANNDTMVARKIGLRLFYNWCHSCAVLLVVGKGQTGCPHR